MTISAPAPDSKLFLSEALGERCCKSLLAEAPSLADLTHLRLMRKPRAGAWLEVTPLGGDRRAMLQLRPHNTVYPYKDFCPMGMGCLWRPCSGMSLRRGGGLRRPRLAQASTFNSTRPGCSMGPADVGQTWDTWNRGPIESRSRSADGQGARHRRCRKESKEE